MSQLVRKIQRQADTNASNFLNLRSAWDRACPDPDMAGIVIPGSGPTQLAYCLCLTDEGRYLNTFAMLKKMCLLSPKDQD